MLTMTSVTQSPEEHPDSGTTVESRAVYCPHAYHVGDAVNEVDLRHLRNTLAVRQHLQCLKFTCPYKDVGDAVNEVDLRHLRNTLAVRQHLQCLQFICPYHDVGDAVNEVGINYLGNSLAMIPQLRGL